MAKKSVAVRFSVEHRRLARIKAAERSMTLREWIEEAIERAAEQQDRGRSGVGNQTSKSG
jgi:hypothetical protein